MARLEDLLQGLRLEDLPEQYADLAPILTALDSAITSLGNAVRGNLTLADNVAVEKLDVQLTHGVAQTVALKKLRRVGSVIGFSAGLDANGTAHAFAFPPEVKPATAFGMAQVVAYFRDPTAVRVQCSLFVEPGGTSTSKIAAGGNPLVVASSTAGQSINNAAYTTIVFDTETMDTDAAYDNATGIFTVPAQKSGDYFISATAAFAQALVATDVEIDININNGTREKVDFLVNPGAVATMNLSDVVRLSAGDTVRIDVYQNAGVAKSLQPGVGYVRLTIKRIP